MNRLLALLREETTDSDVIQEATRCIYIAGMVNYFLNKGVTVDQIFKNVNVDMNYIRNEDNWINYRDLVHLMKNCQDVDKTITIYDWYDAGVRIGQHLQKVAFKTIAAIKGSEFMYRKFIEKTESSVRYASASIVRLGNGFSDITFTFKDKFNEYGLGHGAYWFAGVVASIPTARGAKPAEAKVLYQQMLLKNLIEVLYEKHGLTYEEDDNKILINGKLMGVKVMLLQDPRTGLFVPDYIEDCSQPNATVVLDNIDSHGVRLVKKGEIFDAPYCRMQFKWNKELIIRSPKYYFLDRWKIQKDAASILEQKIVELDKRYFAEKQARLRESALRIRAEFAEAQVREYATTLEQKVAERTSELREANAELAATREAYAQAVARAERQKTERSLSGAFAHDIQNPITGLAGLVSHLSKRILPELSRRVMDLGVERNRLTENLIALIEEYNISESSVRNCFEPILRSMTESLEDMLGDIIDGKETLEYISKAVAWASKITDDLREYASLTDPEKGFERGNDTVNITNIAKSVVNNYLEKLNKLGVKCHINSDNSVINGKETHIYRIINNLVSNAVYSLEASKKGTELVIDIKKGNDFIAISVYDDGLGIKSENNDRIYNASFTTKVHEETGVKMGTGFGLPIIKDIVEQLYNGKISHESEYGKYAKFTVIIR